MNSCQAHNSSYPCLLCDHIKGIKHLREQLRIAREGLERISKGQACWIGEEKRPYCVDFEQCDCADLEAKETLAKMGEIK